MGAFRRVGRWFSPQDPKTFFKRLGWISVLAFFTCVATFMAIALSRPVLPGDPLLLTLLIIFLAIAFVWALVPIVVSLVVGIGLPAPIPLRERNLVLAVVTWGVRVGWGAVVLVIGGFVGGFVAQQLDAINARYGALTPSPYEATQSLSSADVAANVLFADTVFAWISAIFVLLTLLFTYVVTGWLTLRLVAARTDGRREALARSLRRLRETTAKAAWIDYLARWPYPVFFFLVFPLIGYIVAFGIGAGIDGIHHVWIAWLNHLTQ